MSDEIRPPPLPARDIEETQPGLGETPREAQLRVENMRLRRERNQARSERDSALTSSAPGGSIPPDLTRKQKLVKAGLSGAQITLLTSIVAVLIPLLAKKWPAYADIISAVAQNLGLQ